MLVLFWRYLYVVKKRKSLCGYFTKGEIILWCVSVALILASFFMFDRENFLTLAASLIGVTSLIFNAKGNPFGQFLYELIKNAETARS